MMRKTSVKKAMSTVLCSVLIAAALITSGCSDSSKSSSSTANSSSSAVESITSESESSEAVSSDAQEVTVLGEGETQFSFVVVDEQGAETAFEIHTDETTVGAALVNLGLIEGENSEYGLYVKTVNGITADYDVDGTYWAFYVDGEYASTGVDSTEISAGSVYKMAVEKG